MYSLNGVEDADICFRDIKRDDLPEILKRYNDVQEFKYATGMDHPIDLEKLTEKYIETQICSSEFFAAVYSKPLGRTIGIVKGWINYKNTSNAWISSLLIDKEYRGKGCGTRALELLMHHFVGTKGMEKVFLSVVEENVSGVRFWEKNGFRKVRYMENHLVLDGRPQNIIIMCRGRE